MAVQIPFVADVDAEEYETWLKLLNDTVVGADVVRPEAVSTPAAIEVAIVANPDVQQLLEYPNLKWIQSLWAGVEGILKEPRLDHIPLVRMTDPNLAATMAEAVLAWTLYLHRDMPQYAEQQRQRIWQQQTFTRASDRTIGILGLGKLGLAVVDTLKANAFSVLGWSRSLKNIEGMDTFAGAEGLTTMLGQSDIVICLLPHTPATWNLLNTETFVAMKQGSSLINFGRGACVEPNALIAALDAGHLSHAVLDVFKKEPLPGDNPLWHHEKITVLPHVSAPTDPITASQLVAKNIIKYLVDESLPDLVDRSAGY